MMRWVYSLEYEVVFWKIVILYELFWKIGVFWE
jgi:hypothetical protein